MQMYVEFICFQVTNPLFLSPMGYRRIVSGDGQPLHDLYWGFIDAPVKFQLYILKTLQMHFEFTFVEWLTFYF